MKKLIQCQAKVLLVGQLLDQSKSKGKTAGLYLVSIKSYSKNGGWHLKTKSDISSHETYRITRANESEINFGFGTLISIPLIFVGHFLVATRGA